VARNLGKESFGKLAIILSTVALFQMFADFGLGLMSTKYIAEYHGKYPQKTSRILSLSFIIAVTTGSICATVMLVLAPWLSHSVLSDASLTPLLRISAITIFFSAMNGAQSGSLAGFQAFKTLAKANIISGILSFPLIAGGAYFYGIRGVVLGMAISQSLSWCINHIALRVETSKSNVALFNKDFLSELPTVWKFALPAVMSEFLITPANWICRSMLVNQPNGYTELGIFAASLQIARIIVYLVTVLGVPLLPLLVEGNNISSNKQVEHLNIYFYWWLSLVFFLPLMAFPEILGIVFGPQFYGKKATLTFVLVLFYNTINMFKRGLGNAVVADGRMWWAFLSNTFWGILLIIIFIQLVKFGSIGFAISKTFAYVLNTVIFVPVYLGTGLVPKGTIISIRSLSIWFFTIITAISSFCIDSLAYRSLFFVAVSGMLLLVISSMVTKIRIH